MKSKKTLGAIESKLLTTLASQDRNIFFAAEAQKVLGGSQKATNLFLNRLVKKKWLIRLVRGKYLIIPLSAGPKAEHSENWYIIAKNLIEPKEYYLSHYSALDIHDMTVNPPITVYISSPIRRIPKEILGATFRFVYVQPRDLWGIEDVWITPHQKARVSNFERTIIDCLDRPALCGGVSETAKGLWAKRNEVDYNRLIEYAEKRDRKSVIKRLGFLLETYKLGDNTIPRLKTMISPSYTLLDPALPASGHYNRAWRLRLNLDPAELKEITQT